MVNGRRPAFNWRGRLHTWATRLRRRLNYTSRRRVAGAVVKIPNLAGLRCPTSEPWLLELLPRLLADQAGAFWDVGVNLGQTLVKVKALDPARPYVGFEPNPNCIFYVRRLIQANHFDGCTLLPVGLFSRDAVLPLHRRRAAETDASASLLAEVRRPGQAPADLAVAVFTFDSLAAAVDTTAVAIIKIDVEGAELEVVQTLRPLINARRPLLLLEVLPVYAPPRPERQRRQTALAGLLAELDYAILRVQKGPAGHFAGLQPCADFGGHGDLTQCDYVITPREQLAPFLAQANN